VSIYLRSRIKQFAGSGGVDVGQVGFYQGDSFFDELLELVYGRIPPCHL
jgi:hypothetical protein